MDDPLIVLLANTSIFQGLTTEELMQVRDMAFIRQHEAASYIVRQGDPAEAYYLFISGSAKIIENTHDGRQILIRFIIPGDTYGIAAVFDDLGYNWSMLAIDDCQLLVWPRMIMANLIRQYNQIAMNSVRILLLRRRELQHRFVELATLSVEQRLAQALIRMCDDMGRETDDGCLLMVPLTREDLAEYAGTTVYSVSRFLQKWERNGWVRSGRERVAVLDQNSLHNLVKATF